MVHKFPDLALLKSFDRYHMVEKLMRAFLGIICIAAMSCSCQTVTLADDLSTPAKLAKTILRSRLDAASAGITRVAFVGDFDPNSVDLLLRAIADNQNSKAIILEIDSPGGEIDSGFLLSKAIERSKAPVHCIVDGRGMSMAFYILQSCKTRAMTKRSVLMIHGPAIHGGIGGNKNSLRETSEYLDALQNGMVEHMAKRLKITKLELAAKIEVRAWWLNWEEAAKIGAVDVVVDNVEEFVKKF